jgi:hypothetical protein
LKETNKKKDMCFSATASVIAGGLLSPAGVMTIKETKKIV